MTLYSNEIHKSEEELKLDVFNKTTGAAIFTTSCSVRSRLRSKRILNLNARFVKICRIVEGGGIPFLVTKGGSYKFKHREPPPSSWSCCKWRLAWCLSEGQPY